MTISIGGKEREVKMKMLAVNVYRKLTGVNIAGRDHKRFTDIVGDGKDKEFDPDLFVSFLYAVLVNGCHPSTPDFTRDDVADWINLYDHTIVGKLSSLYMEEMTGKPVADILAQVETAKNPQAPLDGATPGTTTSELLTGV
jgi:hypothetical protein